MKWFLLSLCCFWIGCDKQTLLFTDFEKGQRMALEKKSKILVIFDNFGNPTGCVEAWLKNRQFQKALKPFVVVRLRCDDRKQKTVNQTVGNYNVELQTCLAGIVYQPMICIFDSLGKNVSEPIGYGRVDKLVKIITNYH